MPLASLRPARRTVHCDRGGDRGACAMPFAALPWSHMVHEMMVGLTVTDDAVYQQYRDAMAPLLAAHGGGFRYDFKIAEVLKSASDHPINRVFAIFFASKERKDAFFTNADYLAIKARFFAPAVAGTTVIAAYDR